LGRLQRDVDRSTNDVDFWTTQEYAATPPGDGFDRWGTWWGKVTSTAVSSLSINDVTATGRELGHQDFTFTVTLSPPSAQTSPSTTPRERHGDRGRQRLRRDLGRPHLRPTETSKPVNVTVNGDTKFEASETFFVNLSSAVNAGIADGQGMGTITNDDAAPSLSIGDAVVTEGNSGSVTAVFTVTQSAVSGMATTVNYTTTDGTATASSGDYMATSGMVTIPVGSTTSVIMVSVLGDTLPEPDETFFVDLFSPRARPWPTRAARARS